MLNRKNLFTATLVAVSLLASLSVTNSDAAKKNKLKLNKKRIILTVGEKITLKTKCDIQVKWKSSNKKVASVSSKGIVAAKKMGSAKITAYNKKQKATCSVKVKPTNNNPITIPGGPVTTSTPTPIPTPTPAPTPTQNPTPTPAPTSGDVSDKPVIAADTWLLFDIDQDVITKNTTSLSGIMLNYKNTAIKVKVNDIVIAEKVYTEETSAFVIETDFSECQVGDKIEIIREYLGNTFQQTPSVSIKVWNVSKDYVLKEQT